MTRVCIHQVYTLNVLTMFSQQIISSDQAPSITSTVQILCENDCSLAMFTDVCGCAMGNGHEKQIIVYEVGGEVAADTFQLLLSGHFA